MFDKEGKFIRERAVGRWQDGGAAEAERDDCTAIDRNVWQYLVETMAVGYDSASDGNADVRAERIAALRLFLWGVELWVSPSVQMEAERLADSALREANERMRDLFLREIRADQLDQAFIADRTAVLLQHWSDRDDCRAIAEVEAAWRPPYPGRVARLLTFDKRLVRGMSPHAAVALMWPSTYWGALAIPRGTPPCWQPDLGNPLSGASWWHW